MVGRRALRDTTCHSSARDRRFSAAHTADIYSSYMGRCARCQPVSRAPLPGNSSAELCFVFSVICSTHTGSVPMFPGSYIPRVLYIPRRLYGSGEHRSIQTAGNIGPGEHRTLFPRSGVPRSESAPHGEGFYTASLVRGALLMASPICYVLPAGQRSALSRCLCGWTLLHYIV